MKFKISFYLLISFCLKTACVLPQENSELNLDQTISYLKAFNNSNSVYLLERDNYAQVLRNVEVKDNIVKLQGTLGGSLSFNINNILFTKSVRYIKENKYDYVITLKCNKKDCINYSSTLKSNYDIWTKSETSRDRLFNALIHLQKLISSVNSSSKDDLFDTEVQKYDNIQLAIQKIELIDKNSNNRIEQNENSSLSISIINQGINLSSLKIKCTELNNIKGITFQNLNYVNNILSNQAKIIEIPIASKSDLETGEAVFEINFICNEKTYLTKTVKIATFNSGPDNFIISKVVDVDCNIPINSITKPNVYALIIGNEDYKTKQTDLNEEANVKFASNDAKIIMEYINKTIGVPKTNITYLINATSVQIKQAINKIKQLPSINPNAEIIFYYAGHGLPDDKTKEQYLVPVDVSGSNISFGIKINDLVLELSENKPQKTTIILDACFSGAGRNESLLSNRGVKVRPIENVLKGNTIIISSSLKEEASKAYDEMQHGMFTYYLLKKIQETKGNVNLQDLYEYLYFNVREKSILINNQLQTPTISISPEYKKSLVNTSF